MAAKKTTSTTEPTLRVWIKCICADGATRTVRRKVKDVTGKEPNRTGTAYWQGQDRKVTETAEGFTLKSPDVAGPTKADGTTAKKAAATKPKKAAAKKGAKAKKGARASKAKSTKEADRRAA